MANVSRTIRIGQATLQSSRFASTSTSTASTNSSSSDSLSTTKLNAPGPKQRAREEAYDAMIEKIDARRARRTTCEHFYRINFFKIKARALSAQWREWWNSIVLETDGSILDSQFEKLGSTQNRSNTWKPSHSLHRPITPPALTQSHLVAAGAHLGHSPTLTHRSAFPHIYGTRAGISYIDMRQTLPHLRRAAEIVRGVVERDGIVVFVGSLKGAERAVWENVKRLGKNGYGVTKWLPGSISNAKEVFGWCEIPESGQRLTPSSFKPSLLVLLSPTLNQHALREATLNEIPTIGICDTDVDPRCVTYAIPANDDSPRAVELIAGVLGMAGKDGLARKVARFVIPFLALFVS